MRARRRRLEPIGKILCFVRNQPITKFHDTDGIGGLAIIGQHEFGDPEIAAPDDPPNIKSLVVGLNDPAFPNISTTAEALDGLRIVEQTIHMVDFVLALENSSATLTF